MKINKKGFKLEINDGCIHILINWQVGKQKSTHKRMLWLCYSNAKRDKSIYGEKGKYHFCLDIHNIITIDTAYCGKKMFGRVNLTRLFKRDYKTYSSNDSVQSYGE